MRATLPWLCLLVAACTVEDGVDGDTDVLPEPAPAVTPSASCPDLSSTGIVSFTSGGEARTTGIWYPKGDTTGLPVVFVWHGLTAPGLTQTGSVAGDMALGLGLEDWAIKQKAIVVVPEALEDSLVGIPVYLWGILFDEDMQRDLTLYDDLRSCVASELGGDLTRLSSFGFSGGALWNSLLIMHRADTLAAAVSASGGTGQASELLNYLSPANTVPTLLIDGGETDLWPNDIFPLVRFFEATEDLRDNLADDGSYVVHCRHNSGHTITQDTWKASKQWLLRHTFGAVSPYEDGTVGTPRGCTVATR